MLKYYLEVFVLFGDHCTEVFRVYCQKTVKELLIPGSENPFPSLSGNCCYFFQSAELCSIQVITFFLP